MEKEAFPFGVRLQEFAYWVNGGRFPAALFTDHKNLIALFNDKARPLSCTKPNRARLTRWGINLLSMKYVIYHIDGEENRLADLGSRWGSRYAKKRSSGTSVTDGLTGGPKPLLNCFLHRMRDDEPVVKAALRTKPPSVSDATGRPDRNLVEGFTVPAPTHLLNRERIAASQKTHRSSRPKGLKPSDERPLLWQNANGLVWIPDADEAMRKMLYAVAHQGMQGHRGQKVTLAVLQTKFFWTDMKEDVARWSKACLQCIKLSNGEFVPRPLGSQLIAEYPGEILMMDYIKMGASRSGYSYVLMLVDKFSRLVEFVPAVSPTSIVAARSVVRWSAQRGLPLWLFSDGGSHFKNSLMTDLSATMGIDHHVTLPYCPWANGSVEVVGKDLLFTCRSLCSELQVAVDEWDAVLPLAEYAINHRTRDILGGRSAVEVMTGRAPRTATDLALYSGPTLKEAVDLSMPAALVDQYCDQLAESLATMHDEARDAEEANRRRRALREAGKGPGMRFNVGDYVMVSATKNQANRKRHNKNMVRWQGPYEVMSTTEAPTIFEVRLVGTEVTSRVHWQKMIRIAGPGLFVSQAVQNTALHDLQRFLVQSIDQWRLKDDGTVELLIRWQGYDESERTWEPLAQVYEYVEVITQKYVHETDHPTLTQALDQVIDDELPDLVEASSSDSDDE